MPPPVLVKRPLGGVKIAPVVVRYGCKVRVTFGLVTDDVAVMSSRCLLRRYPAAVTVTTSGSGLTVTMVNSGNEVVPPTLVAVMVRFTGGGGATCPSGSTGAVKVSVAVLGPVEVTTML